MSVIFFQKYWDVTDTDVTSMVLNVLNCNMSIIEINKTNITLVPKTNSPSKMTKYRPISLSNVAYKLISKVHANRLKEILPHIIKKKSKFFSFKKANHGQCPSCLRTYALFGTQKRWKIRLHGS